MSHTRGTSTGANGPFRGKLTSFFSFTSPHQLYEAVGVDSVLSQLYAMCDELARLHRGDTFVSRLVARVVPRPGEITELRAFYAQANAWSVVDVACFVRCGIGRHGGFGSIPLTGVSRR